MKSSVKSRKLYALLLHTVIMLWLWSIMDCIFATKPPLFTPQCEVEANWNWFCLSTKTHSFHTERPGALRHKSGHNSTWTLFSYLYPSLRLILTKISSVALLWSSLHLVSLGAAFQRTPKLPVDSQKPPQPSLFFSEMIVARVFTEFKVFKKSFNNTC